MKDLKQKTVRSGLAKLVGQVADFTLRFASLIIMSRLLDPKDFGLIAMVTAVTGLYGLFTSAGLSIVTIQAPAITNEQLSTLFWINIAVGTTLALLCLLTAPILVHFYHESRLFWVTVVVAMGFVLHASAVQHSALLQRHMRYVTLAVIETSSQLAGFAVGITMAIGGFGYWAIVGTGVASTIMYVICVWAATRWIPGAPRRNVGIGSMLRWGGTLTLNNVVVYLAYNTEKVLLGRFWGADILGLYGRAYQLINIPTENLNSAIGGVAFSALSRLQDDPARFRSYFLKGYSLVNSLTLPITIFCALFSAEIILVCLGPKWTEAAPIFRLLTPTIMIFGIINPLAWLLQSTGLYMRSFKIGLVLAPLVITAFVIGLPYGPTGVALAFSTVMSLWLIPHVLWCLHGTIISPSDLLLAISRPLLSAILAAAFAFCAQLYIGESASALLRLLIAGSIMVTVYFSTLLFIFGQNIIYLDILRGLRGTPSLHAKEAGGGSPI